MISNTTPATRLPGFPLNRTFGVVGLAAGGHQVWIRDSHLRGLKAGMAFPLAPQRYPFTLRSTLQLGAGMAVSTVLKQPSAFLPVAMSLGALATVIIHVALFGTARQADEGTAAHIWQLLMAGQLPIVAYFAMKWLPKSPREALPVLALQAVAGLAALAPVYLLHF